MITALSLAPLGPGCWAQQNNLNYAADAYHAVQDHLKLPRTIPATASSHVTVTLDDHGYVSKVEFTGEDQNSEYNAAVLAALSKSQPFLSSGEKDESIGMSFPGMRHGKELDNKSYMPKQH